MQKKFRVKKGYVYIDKLRRPQAPGTELVLDAVDDYVKKQLWKLEVIGDVQAPKTPTPIPMPNVAKEAEDLVNSLDFLTDPTSKDPNEPPKVVVDPDAVKPGEGVKKEEAETMLDRVEKFIKDQQEEQEAKK